MGRYYDGDISGKFWFGVQESTAPENLGAHPMKITYCWDSKEELEKQLHLMEDKLGDNLKKLDAFFQENSSYNEITLSEYLGIRKEDITSLLEIYSDICLGRKVKKYLDSGNNYCIIDCEL